MRCKNSRNAFYFAAMTIGEAYKQLQQQLWAVYDDNEAAVIADMVVEHVTGFRQMDRVIHKATVLLHQQEIQLQKHITELLTDKPVQYVIGEAWFANMKFLVNEHVLIPRPETEELIEWVAGCGLPITSLLDIGTGSGCIPIALKKKLPVAVVTSVDVSVGALQVAQQNATLLNADVDFRLLDFLDEAQWKSLGTYDIIVSNPPYIKESESSTMRTNVLAFEPHIALFVPYTDALLFYKKIAAFGKTHLNKNGCLFMEINEALGNETIAMLESAGYIAEPKKDMQGKDRMVKATLR